MVIPGVGRRGIRKKRSGAVKGGCDTVAVMQVQVEIHHSRLSRSLAPLLTCLTVQRSRWWPVLYWFPFFQQKHDAQLDIRDIAESTCLPPVRMMPPAVPVNGNVVRTAGNEAACCGGGSCNVGHVLRESGESRAVLAASAGFLSLQYHNSQARVDLHVKGRTCRACRASFFAAWTGGMMLSSRFLMIRCPSCRLYWHQESQCQNLGRSTVQRRSGLRGVSDFVPSMTRLSTIPAAVSRILHSPIQYEDLPRYTLV